MRVRELEIHLAKILGYPAGQIDQRVRPLREYGLVPMGGHGLHAPDIEPQHAALMLLQLVSLRASDAFDVGFQAMNLQFVPVPGVPNAFFGADEGEPIRLAAALALLLMDQSLDWSRLEIACDGSRAWLVVDHDGVSLDLLFDRDAAAIAKWVDGDLSTYRNQGAGYFGHRFVMGAGMVGNIGLKLGDKEQASYAPSAALAAARFRDLLAAATLPAPERECAGAE